MTSQGAPGSPSESGSIQARAGSRARSACHGLAPGSGTQLQPPPAVDADHILSRSRERPEPAAFQTRAVHAAWDYLCEWPRS